MESLIASVLAGHLALGIGVAGTLLVEHHGAVIGFLVNQLFRLPAVRKFCAAHPTQVKAVVNEIAVDVDKAVDADQCPLPQEAPKSDS